jgi:hypothetical protein
MKQKTNLHEFLMYFMEEEEEEALDSTLLFVLLE